MPDEQTIDATIEPDESAGNQPQAEPVGELGNRSRINRDFTEDSTDVSRGTTKPDEGVSEYTPEELSKLALEQIDIARVPEDRRTFVEERQKERRSCRRIIHASHKNLLR